MSQHDDVSLTQDWHAFLERNQDAQIIVNDLMVRTGFSEAAALFYLLAEWANSVPFMAGPSPAM
jgi:hypothetical protein